MPDDLAEMRDRFLTAVINSASAEDAADAAAAELAEAKERARQAGEAQDAAHTAEIAAHTAYVAALRSHGYVETASGPAPAPGVTVPVFVRICICEHPDSEHDDDGMHSCQHVDPDSAGICACLAFREAGCGSESPKYPGLRCSLVAGHADDGRGHYAMGTRWAL